MVGTIGPLVKVAKAKWLMSITLFFAGSLIGGVVVMLIAAGVGRLLGVQQPDRGLPFAVIVVALLGAVVDLRILRVAVPTPQQSVPQRWWMEHGAYRASLAYGTVLGMGVTTFIPVATFYSLLLIAACQDSPVAAMMGATYGLARALPVLVGSVLMALNIDDRAIGRWPLGWPRSFARRACGGALMLTLVLAALGQP